MAGSKVLLSSLHYVSTAAFRCSISLTPCPLLHTSQVTVIEALYFFFQSIALVDPRCELILVGEPPWGRIRTSSGIAGCGGAICYKDGVHKGVDWGKSLQSLQRQSRCTTIYLKLGFEPLPFLNECQ